MKFPETYTALVLSTGHLRRTDADGLRELAEDEGAGMVFARDEGFLVKLYDTEEGNRYLGLSEGTNYILVAALRAGHRLVEFDRDGPTMDGLPTYDW